MHYRNRMMLGLVVFTILRASSVSATYSLTWSDEFDGSSLNAANWTADIGNGCPSLCGWGNNELEYYRSQNVTVTGGNLVLTAKAESYGGSSFTSGKVHTRNKQTFLYGRVEMRAKLPTGGGMWPAFWMMPQADVYGGWAASGEIDIMESANATTSVGGALHYGGSWPDNTSTSSSYSLGGANFADTFHIYSVEWEPDAIRWYVDGVLFMTRTSSQWYTNAAPGNPRAPFDQEFYIILNAAVGGEYTGCTSSGCISASFPQQYLIDYVRVYEDITNVAPTVSITSPTTGDNPPAGDIVFTAEAADADGSVVTVEFFLGAMYLGADTTAPYIFTWTSVADGCYTVTAKVIDDLGGSSTDTVDLTVGAGCGQAPYLGTPFVLPVRIEAEDFDIGGDGIAYDDQDLGNTGGQYRPGEDVDIEACSDTGGGYGVGWISAGEWLEYTVVVPADGDYTLDLRYASVISGAKYRVEFDGVDVTGEVIAPASGGWQRWETSSSTVTLAAGQRTMRFTAIAAGFNINYIDFPFVTTGVAQELPPTGFVLHPCYPNPFNPSTTIRYDLPASAKVGLVVYDVAGRLVRTLVAAETVGAGSHEVVWNGRDESGRVASAGVYYCRLDAGQYAQTRRMTLVK